MTKLQFLLNLHDRLSDLPQDDVEERLRFYSEMIEDRMEDGLSEEQAVEEIGAVDAVAAQIIADTPLTKNAKEKIKPKRRLKVWEIVLLAIGSPVWVSLLVAACAVAVSLYVVLWSVIVSLWAVFAAVIGTAVCGIACGAAVAVIEYTLSGVALLGVGIACIGLAVLLFFGCKAVTKGTVVLTRKGVSSIKNMCIGKGNAV